MKKFVTLFNNEGSPAPGCSEALHGINKASKEKTLLCRNAFPFLINPSAAALFF
jgi:hypothetical protein